MKPAVLVLFAATAACDITDSLPDPAETPDAAIAPGADAADPAPMEPRPAFTAGTQLGGQLAIDGTTIRPSFTVNGQTALSYLGVGLTETATAKTCGVKLFPHLVQFGSSSTSTRQFRTVVLDFGQAEILEDTCGWDDAHILAGLKERFGNYIVGFAQARFAEDRPYLDVYLNATKGLGSGTASVVRAGSGSAYQMNPDGSVVEVMVEPTTGTAGPLVSALYDF